MVGDIRARNRRLALMTVAVLFIGMFALSDRSDADVTAVQGSAYGYQTSVGLFGGPPGIRGFGQVTCTAPNVPAGCAPATAESPSVTLPATGGTVSDTDPDGASGQYGPAVIFGGIWPEAAGSAPPSGPITVDCTGTTGPGGAVTCNTAITLRSPANALSPGGIGPGPIVANEARSTCRAVETDPSTGAKSITGSASFVNGVLETKYDAATQLPTVTEAIPDSPPANYTRSGTIDHVGDSYTVIFNEQITNPDGSLTVNAVHLRLLGPTAVGDMIIGSVTCGLTTVGVPTTSTTPTTQTPTTQTPTTQTPTTQTPTTQTPTTQTPTTQTPTTQTPTTQTPTTQTPTTQTPTTQTPTTQTPTTQTPTTQTPTTQTPTTQTPTTQTPTTQTPTTQTPTTQTPTTQTPTTLTPTTVVTTTTSTQVPPITTTSLAPFPGLSDLFRQIVCPILRALAANPFIGPFIQPFLGAFGCPA